MTTDIFLTAVAAFSILVPLYFILRWGVKPPIWRHERAFPAGAVLRGRGFPRVLAPAYGQSLCLRLHLQSAWTQKPRRSICEAARPAPTSPQLPVPTAGYA